MIVDPDSEMYRLKVDMESGNSKFLVQSTKAVDKVVSTKSSSNGNFEDMWDNFSFYFFDMIFTTEWLIQIYLSKIQW